MWRVQGLALFSKYIKGLKDLSLRVFLGLFILGNHNRTSGVLAQYFPLNLSILACFNRNGGYLYPNILDKEGYVHYISTLN